MADSIGTLSLKISADAQGLTSALAHARGDVEKFTSESQRAADDLVSRFTGLRDRALGIFGDFASGDFKGAFLEIGKAIDDALAGADRQIKVEPKVDLGGLAGKANQANDLFRGVGATAVRTAEETRQAFDITTTMKVVADTASFVRDTRTAKKEAVDFGTAADAAKAAATAAGAKTEGIFGSLASKFGRGAIAGAGAAAIAGLVVAAYKSTQGVADEANKELKETKRLADLIGVSTREARVLRVTLDKAGIQDAESTIVRFTERLGSIRDDAEGSSGDAFRRLGLDPQQLAQMNPVESLRATVDALSRVRDAYTRNQLAQDTMGQSYLQLQQLLQSGGAGFDAAGRSIDGMSRQAREAIEAAQEAQRRWTEAGKSWGGLWGDFTGTGSSALTSVSHVAGTLASGLGQSLAKARDNLAWIIAGMPDVSEVPTLGGRPADRPDVFPKSQAEVAAEREIAAIRRRTGIDRGAREEAARLGYIAVNATEAEVRAASTLLGRREDVSRAIDRQLEQTRQGIVKEFQDGKITVEQRDRLLEALERETAERKRQLLIQYDQAQQEALAADRAEQRAANVRRSQEGIDTLRSDASDPRSQAQSLGFIRPGATRAEVDAVRDLVNAYNALAEAGATGEQLMAARDRLTETARRRRDTAATVEIEAGQDALRARRALELEGLTLARLRERLALEQGISAEKAKRLRAIGEENRALDVIQELRSPVDDFNRQRREIQDLQNAGKLNADQAAQAIGQRFNQLVQGLGPGPSSFALRGTSSRSVEGVAAAEDFRVRGQIENDPQRPIRLAEQAVRQRDQMRQEMKRVGQVIVDAINNGQLQVFGG